VIKRGRFSVSCQAGANRRFRCQEHAVGCRTVGRLRRRSRLGGLRLPSLRGRARPPAELADVNEVGIGVGQRQRTAPGTAPRSAPHMARRRKQPAVVPESVNGRWPDLRLCQREQ
jgi:hypothetical protein